MNYDFYNRLTEALQIWMERQDQQQTKPSVEPRLLAPEEVTRLAGLILRLPVPLHDVLFLRFCFDFGEEEIESSLDLPHPGQQASLTVGMLEQIMGLDAPIAESSLRQACEMALERYTQLPFSQEDPEECRDLLAQLEDAVQQERSRRRGPGKNGGDQG